MSVLRDSPHLTDHDDGMVDEYRAVSGWAVAALILGLLAPLALVDVWLSLIPLAGIAVAVVALVRIAVLAPTFTGQKAALAGLFLSVLCLSAAGADQWVFWRSIHGEARQFAKAWFEFLAEHEPLKAHQLSLPPSHRQPLDERLPDYYEEGEPWHEALEAYLAQPVVQKLLDLGGRARLRYHATEASGRDAHSVGVRQLFAVTYDDADRGTTTFLVRLAMQRLPLEHGQAAWRLVNVEEKKENLATGAFIALMEHGHFTRQDSAAGWSSASAPGPSP